MQFILENLPVLLCIIVGTALVVFETFIPGFGVPGITGCLLLGAGVALTWINHGMQWGLIILLCSLVLCAVSISVSLHSAAKGKLSKSRLILRNDENAGKEAEDMSAFLGREGRTLTVLRPAGMAEFDGVKLSVVSDGEFIPKDTRVTVFRTEGTRIVVKETGDAPQNKKRG